MQLTHLDYVYRISDLVSPDGPVTPSALYRCAEVVLSVRPNVKPFGLALLQTGKLCLAQRYEVDDLCLPKGSAVYADTLWWTEDGFAGTSVLIANTWLFVTNAPLDPKRQYTLSGHFSGQGHAPKDGLMAGSKIRTATGMKQVSRLRPGDTVWTEGDQMRPVRAVYKRTCAAIGSCAPVVIKAGTLGVTHDLVLPPDQAITLSGDVIEGYLGNKHRKARIGDLVNGDTVWSAQLGFATYILADLAGPACVNINGAMVHLSGGSDLGAQIGTEPLPFHNMLESSDGLVVGALL